MSYTITLKVKNMQPNDFKLHGVPVVLKEGNNSIDVNHWLVIKPTVERKISKGFIEIDRNEEFQSINSFKLECFSEFEQLGIPQVKVSVEKGELAKGVKHPFALEWLESKLELRESMREGREEESLSISREALRISKRAIIWSAIATLIAVISIYVNNS